MPTSAAKGPVANAQASIGPRYRRPPIIEALIDIQVTFATEPSLERLQEVGDAIEQKYPSREPLYSFSIEADADRGTAKTSQNLLGYRYWTSARNGVVQYRTNGFLFSRIPQPGEYDGWKAWRPEAEWLWKNYREALGPIGTSQLTVRYINRIDIPSDAPSFSDFFTVSPQLPAKAAGPVRTFVTRVDAPLSDIEGGKLSVGQGTVQPPSPNLTAVLLDLSVSRDVAFNFPSDDARMWESIQQLHNRENKLFEDFLTTKTRTLFK